MSKIYEALRRHDQQPLVDEAEPLPIPLPRESFPVSSATFVASRQMQTLLRSVEAALAGIQDGTMIMFSSARPGEGKTMVCGSFAVTLAQDCGKSVLILDGDRDHVLTRQWGTQKHVTSQMLERDPQDILEAGKRFPSGGSISVVPVGSSHGPANGGGADIGEVVALKSALCKTFDYVLIDGPAVAGSSWAPSVAAKTDGVILVIQAERTRWPVALNSKQEFEGSGAKILGAFLNRRRFYIPHRVYRHV
jgi:Mrp family chromosome partitioning ATPase